MQAARPAEQKAHTTPYAHRKKATISLCDISLTWEWHYLLGPAN